MPLEPNDLAPQREQSRHLFTAEEGIDRRGLDRQHVLLDLLDHRLIAIDDEVEHAVQDVVDAVREQFRRCLQLRPQHGVVADRPVANRDDVAFSDEDRGLAIVDGAVAEARGGRDDK